MSDSTHANRLAKSLSKLDSVPAVLRTSARSFILGRVVKFVGTAGLTVEELTPARAVVSVKNRKKVQNHIGSFHAAAMGLLAETASGFVVGCPVVGSTDVKVQVTRPVVVLTPALTSTSRSFAGRKSTTVV